MAQCRPAVNWMQYDFQPTPKSVTHESLEEGRKMQTKVRIIARKQLNFQSYPMNDFRFDLIHVDKVKQHEGPPMSSYSRDYTLQATNICKPIADTIESPDEAFNRRPVNAFQLLPWSNSKFMDDHFTHISPARKKINFFRQLRNQSFSFE